MPHDIPYKGDVWLASIPEGQGHEQKGQRPVIIAGCEPRVAMSVIIPTTSNASAERFPHTQKLCSSKHNGLDSDSVVLVFQIRAIDDARLIHKMGALDPKEQQAIDALVKDLLRF